ncbi:unnamed protein product, partial [Sphacelaria rigidula]
MGVDQPVLTPPPESIVSTPTPSGDETDIRTLSPVEPETPSPALPPMVPPTTLQPLVGPQSTTEPSGVGSSTEGSLAPQPSGATL